MVLVGPGGKPNFSVFFPGASLPTCILVWCRACDLTGLLRPCYIHRQYLLVYTLYDRWRGFATRAFFDVGFATRLAQRAILHTWLYFYTLGYTCCYTFTGASVRLCLRLAAAVCNWTQAYLLAAVHPPDLHTNRFTSYFVALKPEMTRPGGRAPR